MTIRRGSEVSRRRHETLDDALEAMRSEAEAVRAEGGLPELNVIRTFEPSKRVAARLEISRGGLLRGRTAGVDVMGDGSVVAFRGGVVRHQLGEDDPQRGYEAVREALL